MSTIITDTVEINPKTPPTEGNSDTDTDGFISAEEDEDDKPIIKKVKPSDFTIVRTSVVSEETYEQLPSFPIINFAVRIHTTGEGKEPFLMSAKIYVHGLIKQVVNRMVLCYIGTDGDDHIFNVVTVNNNLPVENAHQERIKFTKIEGVDVLTAQSRYTEKNIAECTLNPSSARDKFFRMFELAGVRAVFFTVNHCNEYHVLKTKHLKEYSTYYNNNNNKI